jgi:hypothetical protein
MFANSQTGLPERFASKSQSAQSNALHAAPGVSPERFRGCSLSRSKSRTLRMDSICAMTEAQV